jgi:hypothetical protein
MAHLDELEGEGIRYFDADEWIDHIGHADDLAKGRQIQDRFLKCVDTTQFKVTKEEKRQWAWYYTASFLAVEAVGISTKEALCKVTESHYKKTKKRLEKYV